MRMYMHVHVCARVYIEMLDVPISIVLCGRHVEYICIYKYTHTHTHMHMHMHICTYTHKFSTVLCFGDFHSSKEVSSALFRRFP